MQKNLSLRCIVLSSIDWTKTLWLLVFLVISLQTIGQNTVNNSTVDSVANQLKVNQIRIDTNTITRIIPLTGQKQGDTVALNHLDSVAGISLNFKHDNFHLMSYTDSLKSLIDLKSHDSLGLYKKLSPRLSGSIEVESFATNYQDPFTLSEKVYTRLFGSPTLSIASLPFTADFYVTTESQTVYNSNSLSLRFNPSQFKNNLESKAGQKLKSLEASKDVLEQKKQRLAKEKNQLGIEIEKYKSALELQKSKLDITKWDTPNLDSVVLQKKNTLKQKAQHYRDSTVSNAKSNVDSVQSKYAVDTVMLRDSIASFEQYQQLNQSYQKLLKLYNQLDSLYNTVSKADSSTKERMDKYKALGNPNEIKNKATKYKPSKLIRIASKLEYLDLGISYPFFNKYSLNGVPVNGISTGVSLNNVTLKLASGKTIDTRINSFGLDQPRPSFTRNIQGVFFSKQTQLSLFETSTTALWDSKSADEPKLNSVQTLSFQRMIGRKLSLFINTAHSIYSDNYKIPSEKLDHPSFLVSRLYQSALEVKGKFKLDGNSKLSGEVKRIYPGFMNLSNPFMRSGYDELKFQVDRKFLKRTIHLSANYKQFSDNVLGHELSTNRMNGYGISLRTAFKKGPNFFAQHAPYEQGNNHPDSLFRTQNQLSVTSLGVIYLKQLNKTKLSVIGNITRSHIDFNRGEAPVENRFYNTMVNLTTKNTSISVSVYRNESLPYIDSLNYWGARMNCGQIGTKKLNFSSEIFLDYFDSDDFRYNWVTTVKIAATSKISGELNMGLGRINGLFGLERKDIYSAGLRFVYVL